MICIICGKVVVTQMCVCMSVCVCVCVYVYVTDSGNDDATLQR